MAGVFAVSPIKIQWRPGDSVTFARDEYLFSFKAYVTAVFNLDAWKLLLQGKVGAVGLVRALAHRLQTRLLGWASRSLGDSPLAKTKRFAKRGGRALFFMGVNDSSIEEVETYFGAGGAKLKRQQNVSVEVVPDLDHGLTRRASRELAMDRLANWLTQPRALGE